MKYVLSSAALALVLAPSALAAPAFPGAEGAGATAAGGRGGTVYLVTNLNDAGTGSLRACVEASGPRTCVFRVSGTIKLTSRGYWIDDPYLTVAGQTAPGGGIQISAKAISQSAVMIATHDVVWRYTRVRHGYNSGGLDKASNFMLFEGSERVIIDHNSVAWNQDEGIGIWRSSTAPARNITISWNLVAEGLADHSTGMVSGGDSRSLADGMTNIDWHHNLTMNNSHRNPLILNKSGRMVNNLWYNHRFYATQLGGGVSIDIIANIYKKGPMYGQVNGGGQHEIQAYPNGDSRAPTGTLSLYLAGNKGYYQPNETGDQWLMTAAVASQNGRETGALSTSFRRTSPLPAQTYPITRHGVSSLEGVVLPTVGASRRVDCNGAWVSNRDSTDARLVGQYQNNTGISSLPTNESNVGGYPTLASGTACADVDKDGMPDAWENARKLNPGNAADRNNDSDGDGFTNLEEYLNGT